MIKISVIIPVYNIEELLEQCIESVVSQTYTNKEIILIDDGSTDRSSLICDKYAQKYGFIQVIHKKNEGLSAARNTGIRFSTGEYIMFLDSDDYWKDKAALEKIVVYIEERRCDLVIMGTTSLYSNSNNCVEHHICSRYDGKNSDELLKDIVSQRIYISAAWDKIMCRTLFEDGDLFFSEGITSEDYDWCLRILLKNPTVRLIDEVFLVHRLGRKGSIQSEFKQDNKALFSFESAFDNCISLLEKYEGEASVKRVGEMFVAHMYLQLLGVVAQFPVKVSRKRLKRLKQYVYLLRYDELQSVKKAKYVYKVLGYGLMCKLLSYRIAYIKFKRSKF